MTNVAGNTWTEGSKREGRNGGKERERETTLGGGSGDRAGDGNQENSERNRKSERARVSERERRERERKERMREREKRVERERWIFHHDIALSEALNGGIDFQCSLIGIKLFHDVLLYCHSFGY